MGEYNGKETFEIQIHDIVSKEENVTEDDEPAESDEVTIAEDDSSE